MTARQLPIEPWAAQALCAPMDQETFTDPAQLPTAVAACGHCPAAEDCLLWALDTEPHPAGVWGGHTERQRRHMALEEAPEALGPRRDIPPLVNEPAHQRPADPVPKPEAPARKKQPTMTAVIPRPAPRPPIGAGTDRPAPYVLEVSDRRDGTFAILEGQHRWAATSEARGINHPVVCQVHRGLTPEDEARVFYEIDKRRRALNTWDRWRARRGAGDPAIATIEQVVAGFHMSIGGAARNGTIRSTAALEKLFGDGGRPLLTSTLSIVSAAYGDQLDAYDGSILQAVGEVLKAYRAGTELDTERLVDALATTVPRQLKARAALQREVTPGTMPRLIASVIVGAYNQRPGRNLQAFLERIKPHTSDHSRAEAARSQRMRDWADEEGLHVERDHVPADVREAYYAAHPGETR